MQSDQSYRLVIRSDGEVLLLTLEGALTAGAGQHVRQLQAAAHRFGIPVRVELRHDRGELAVGAAMMQPASS